MSLRRESSQPSTDSVPLCCESSTPSTNSGSSADRRPQVEKASGVLSKNMDISNCRLVVVDALVLSIALHHSPHVQTLNMKSCIVSAEHCAALGRGLTHVKEMNMFGNTGLHGGGLQALTEGLAQCSAVQLEELNLNYCTLNENDCGAIGHLLHTLPSLRRLFIELNYLRLQGIARLLEPLTKSKLELLDLRHNELDSRAGALLGCVVGDHRHLQVLNVSDNQLGNDGVRDLLTGLHRSCSLRMVDLSRTGVDDGVLGVVTECWLLRSALRQTTPDAHTQSLVVRFHGNDISRGGLEEVARRSPSGCQDCLECDSVAVKAGAVINQDYEDFFKDYVRQGSDGDLVMAQQGVGNSGAEQITRLLQVHCNVHALDLDWNSIGDAGAAALGTALQVNTALRGLNLGYNRVGCAGIVSVATTLMTSFKTLMFINLGGNPVFSDSTNADMRRSAREAVQRLVGASTGLRFLSLSNIGLGDEECQGIGEALASDECTLSFLRLGRNTISDKGVDFLCSGLEQNSTIQYLDLSANKISNGGVERIRRCVEVRTQQGRPSFRCIWLGKNRVGADTLTDCMVNGAFAYPPPPNMYTKLIKMYCGW